MSCRSPDLCLNGQTGDTAVLRVSARSGNSSAGSVTASWCTQPTRNLPMARCVAAGAAGFVDKYNHDFGVLVQAADEIGRSGHIVTGSLRNALRKLAWKCRDVRLSDTLERGRQDALSVRKDD